MTLINNISERSMKKLEATYQYVFLGILAAMLGSWLMFPYVTLLSGWTFWGLVLVEFAVLFWFFFSKHIISYFTFTTLTGVTLVPVLAHYVGIGASAAIVQALVGTTMVTGGLTLYASTTTKDYLSMGQTLFWILVGLIAMSIANIFIGSSMLSLGVSMVAVVLFSFFIIHDTQAVLHTDIEPLEAAMGLYLNVLNMFVSLLNIIGFGGDD